MKVKDDTRTRILKEAYREFRKTGYHQADIDMIVKKAGVTKGALYYYFKSKEDLANNVIDHEISVRIEEKFLKGITDELNVKAMLFSFANYLTNDKQEFGTILVKFTNEIPKKQKSSHDRIKAITDRVITKLSEKLAADESFNKLGISHDPVPMAHLIFSIMLGSLTLSKACQNRFVVSSAIAQLDNLLSISYALGSSSATGIRR